jgi:hypothetical protein
VTKLLRTLWASALLLLAVPAFALAAEPAKKTEDQVTLAMFVLIFALIAILAILVAFEARKGSKH